jgi:ABC-type multidrug transport system fused ATPase/permease subunit
MPEGFASAVSQGGTNLSGGQKQRLSIARALVRRPEIYVFDDSFSALDFATDARLRAALKSETVNATVFIVAQRIGTVINADRIIVLDNGRVVASARTPSSWRPARCIARSWRRRCRSRRSHEQRAPPQRPAPPANPFGGRPIGGLGMPTQKAKNFKGTLKRLATFAPISGRWPSSLTGAIGTIFNVVGPKILGLATTKVFEGYVAKRLGVPGAAIDFDYVGWILVRLLGLYVISAAFQYMAQYLMAGVAQNTVYALRKEVEAKFKRLPLKFYDSRTRGEILSRAVNDMDSISGTLQQTLTQLLTSALTSWASSS